MPEGGWRMRGWISVELVPWRRGWISVGDDYELRIPNVVQMGTEEPFDRRPDGELLFENGC